MAIPVIHDTTPTGPSRTVVRRTCPAGHTYISGPHFDTADVEDWTHQHSTCKPKEQP